MRLLRPEWVARAFGGAVLTLTAFIPGPSVAQQQTPPPPYVLTKAKGVVISVTWEDAAVRKVLPAGIRPVADMSGGIVIYEVGEAYGLGPYTSAYFYVDTEDMDSHDGTKAHWMLQGVYGPDPKVSAALLAHYSLPVRTGSSSAAEIANGRRYTGTVNGRTFVTADIKSGTSPCEAASVFEQYPAYNARTKQFVMLQIPETGQWCGAEVQALRIDPAAGDAFSPFKVKSITGAGEFKDWSFAFTQPQPLSRR